MNRISFIAPELKRLESAGASVLVLHRFAEMKPLTGVTSLVDWRLYGHLSRMVIDSFFTGDKEEALLMPLGRHLPQEHLLLFGLGRRAQFGKSAYGRVVDLMFETVRGLGKRDIALALPGRVEGVCDPAEAIEWFIQSYERNGDEQDMVIIEPPGAQKAMMPLVERWRLRQLVP